MTVLSGLQNFISMRLPYMRRAELDQAEAEQIKLTADGRSPDKYAIRTQIALNLEAIAARRKELLTSEPEPLPEAEGEDEGAMVSGLAQTLPAPWSSEGTAADGGDEGSRATRPDARGATVEVRFDSGGTLITPQTPHTVMGRAPADMKWSRLSAVENQGQWEIVTQPEVGQKLGEGAPVMLVVINAAKTASRFRAIGTGRTL